MAYVDQIQNRQGNQAGSSGTLDLSKRRNRGLTSQVDAHAAYLQSPEYQEFANPERLVETQGIDSIYQGARTAQRQAAMGATRAGLGRGAATQFQTDINRSAMSAVSNALLSARLLGGERRAMGSASLMETIKMMQAQLALKRIGQRQGSMTSLFQGNAAAGLGGFVGDLPKIAAGVGAGALGGVLGNSGSNN